MERKTWILIGVVIGISILVLGLLFLRLSAGKKDPKNVFLTSNSSSSEEVDIRLDQLEKAVAKLITEVGPTVITASGSATTTANSPLEAKVNNLQTTVNGLTVAVNQLKTQNNTTNNQTTTSSNQPPSYIPLGWVASSNAMTWTTITSQTFNFNPADYPGMTSVQFSASMLVFQGNGTAYAQLYNSTDNTVVFGSTISTGSQNYVTVTSSNFQLPNAQKTYTLQLLANTGYAATVQGAWLKVNFD